VNLKDKQLSDGNYSIYSWNIHSDLCSVIDDKSVALECGIILMLMLDKETQFGGTLDIFNNEKEFYLTQPTITNLTGWNAKKIKRRLDILRDLGIISWRYGVYNNQRINIYTIHYNID